MIISALLSFALAAAELGGGVILCAGAFLIGCRVLDRRGMGGNLILAATFIVWVFGGILAGLGAYKVVHETQILNRSSQRD